VITKNTQLIDLFSKNTQKVLPESENLMISKFENCFNLGIFKQTSFLFSIFFFVLLLRHGK